ncbi:MAG: bleomycin resistance family protein [Alphaproteobacteria bacterium]|nr:bleomycin resistance family protein [Alphaproteobacteria bacterium]
MVADVERASAFYTGQLGFTESWRHAEDGELLVAQIARMGCELILSSQWPDKVGRGMIFLSLDPDEIETARAEFERRGVSIRNGRWGYDSMIIDDPDGNQLYFPYPASTNE